MSNLTNVSMTNDSIDLSWTAPGDNGTSGQAKQYSLRYASFPITAETWNSATPVSGLSLPKTGGQPELATVGGLTTNATYYFALKTTDLANNISALSNVVTATIINTDTTAPAAVDDLAVQRTGPKSVRLGWTASGDDGETGQAQSYEVRYSTSPITEGNWSAATEAIDELLQLTAGSAMVYQANELTPNTTYYFAVRTKDNVGNVSSLSNVAVGSTAYAVPDSVTVTSLAGLQNAIDTAPVSGRIITLAAGTYSQSAAISITGKDNITIRGATSNPQDTVIVGPGITSGLDISIRVNNSNYATIRDLAIKEFNYHAVQVNSGSYYFHADNVYAWDLGEGAFKTTANPHSQGALYSDYGLIENSVMGYTTGGKRNAVEAVDIIAARGWIVRGNSIYNAYYPTSSSIAYALFAKGGSIDTLFENNLIKGSDVAISFGGGTTASQYFRNGILGVEHYGGIIRNNVIHNTDDAGIYLSYSQGFQVLNNTLINIAPGVSVGGVESRFAVSNGEIRNNLMDKPLKKRNSGNYTASNNNETVPSSWYVDPNASNYSLNPSTASSAIDSGASLPTLVPTDRLGVNRPIGLGFDLGAMESGTPPTDTSAPSAPSGLASAGETGTTVALYWTAATDNVGVVSYDIYAGATKLNALPVTTTDYVAYNLNPLASYSFTVKAKDRAGNVSAASNVLAITRVDLIPPSAPTLSSTGVTETTVSLSWTSATDNIAVAGYDVYNGATKANTGLISGTAFTVTGLTPSTSYTFTAKAVDTSNNASSASNNVTVTTATYVPLDTTPPSAPANFRTTATTQTSFSLAWNASTDNAAVAGYDIYLGGTKVNGATVTGTTYVLTALSANTTYSLYVKAVDTSGNPSAASSTINPRTLEIPPAGTISRTGWTSSASTSGSSSGLDGKTNTRWYTTSHTPSSYYQVDMLAEYDIHQVMFHNGTIAENYAIDYTIKVSTDGTTWTTVGTGDGNGTKFVYGSFATVPARYVRLEPASTGTGWWGFTELYVYGE